MADNIPPQSDTVVEVSEMMMTLVNTFSISCAERAKVGKAYTQFTEDKNALLREIARLEEENRQYKAMEQSLADACGITPDLMRKGKAHA